MLASNNMANKYQKYAAKVLLFLHICKHSDSFSEIIKIYLRMSEKSSIFVAYFALFLTFIRKCRGFYTYLRL